MAVYDIFKKGPVVEEMVGKVPSAQCLILVVWNVQRTGSPNNRHFTNLQIICTPFNGFKASVT